MITLESTIKAVFLFPFINNEWVRSIRSEWNHTDPVKLRERNLLFQIEAAKSHGKISQGAWQVWNTTLQKKGRLLIAEKDVLFPAVKKELIDQTIQKVLEAGGDIEFVENGLLRNYERIVMIHA